MTGVCMDVCLQALGFVADGGLTFHLMGFICLVCLGTAELRVQCDRSGVLLQDIDYIRFN